MTFSFQNTRKYCVAVLILCFIWSCTVPGACETNKSPGEKNAPVKADSPKKDTAKGETNKTDKTAASHDEKTDKPANENEKPGVDEEEVLIQDKAIAREPSMRSLEGDQDIWALAVSPDSKMVASGGLDQKVHLWDVKTGEVIKTLPRQEPLRFVNSDNENYVMALAFSPNGKVLAVGFNDGSFGFWDMKTFEFSRGEQQHSGSVHSLAFSPNGQWLASGSNSSGEDIVKIWDMKTGENYWNVPDLMWRSDSVAFSPNSQWLACATADGQINLVDVQAKEKYTLMGATAGGANYAWTVTFSPDNQTLVAGTYDNEIKFWDIKTRTQNAEWQGTGRSNDGISSLSYSPGGKFLAVCNGHNVKGPAEIRDAKTGQILFTLAERLEHGLIAFAPHGQYVVVGDREKNLFVYSLR